MKFVKHCQKSLHNFKPRKIISKRLIYLKKTHIYRERHGIKVRFSNASFRNYFDRQRRQRIARSTQDKASSRSVATVSECISEINLFEECMVPEDKFLYEKKMLKQKNVTPQEFIRQTLKYADRRQYGFSKYKMKHLQKKSFGLKYINTIIKDINPMKDVRLCDYVFPLDSSPQKDSSSCEQCASYGLFRIKRASELNYDIKEELYTAKMEERFVWNKTNDLNSLNYYVEWLESLGDYRANDLKKGITKYMNNVYKNSCQTDQVIYKKENYSLEKFDKEQRFYMTKQSDETIKFIKERPFCYKKTKMNNENTNGIFCEFGINKKLCEFLGFKGITLRDFNEPGKISPLNLPFTSNWIAFYSAMLYDISCCVTEEVFADKCIVQPYDLYYYRNSKGDKMPGSAKIFRESYMAGEKQYYQTFFVHD